MRPTENTFFSFSSLFLTVLPNNACDGVYENDFLLTSFIRTPSAHSIFELETGTSFRQTARSSGQVVTVVRFFNNRLTSCTPTDANSSTARGLGL